MSTKLTCIPLANFKMKLYINHQQALSSATCLSKLYVAIFNTSITKKSFLPIITCLGMLKV